MLMKRKKISKKQNGGSLPQAKATLIRLCKRVVLSVAVLLNMSFVTAQTDVKISVNFKEENISNVLRYIEKLTRYNFSYNVEQIEEIGKVSFAAENLALEVALDSILGDRFTFDIEGDNIVIMPKDQEHKRVIKGYVFDESQLPLPGAAVMLKEGGKGTITNQDGMFTIEVSGRTSQLEISFLGMKKAVVNIRGVNSINVVLESDNRSLGEIVVVGAYGTVQKRTDMVGSAFQVDEKSLKMLPQARADRMLEGLVPGLYIEPNSDSPSSTKVRYSVRVRGEASMAASNEPLWIVDGKPFYTGDRTNRMPGMSVSVSPLEMINPDDIESMTVLKDAASTSIYGSDGANGVILINTKKGRAGKTSVHVSARMGVAKTLESTKYKVLNSLDYLMLAREAYNNAGKDPALFPFQDNDMNSYSTTNTDWYDVYYRLGNSQQANISVSGGAQTARFYLSGSFFQNKITVDGNRQQRYSIRSNTDLDISKKISFGINIGASYNINEIFNPGSDYYDLLPIFSPYNNDGSFRLYNKVVDGYNEDGSLKYKTLKFFNSVAEREQNDHFQRTALLNTNFSLRYNIIDGLEYTAQFGADYQGNFENTYSARKNWSGMDSDGIPQGYATRAHSNLFNWTNIHRVNLSRSFGLHNIGAVAGFEVRSKDIRSVSSSGSGFVNDHIKEVSYAVSQRGSSFADRDRAMSFFAQGNYNYNQRYYVVMNVRKDGNSNFGKDVRWVNFGSVGLSWNIHNEKFFRSKVINVLKIKASFGSNGNSRLGEQQSQGLYSYKESDRYSGEAGGSMSASPNPKLSWETTYMTNIGVRMRLFERLDIELEGYNNKTVDLLSDLDVSRTTGDTRVYRNVGSIKNQGIELTVSSLNIKGDFEWKTDFNLSHNRNRLLELYNGTQKVMGNKIWQEGKDMNTYYLIRWAGVDPRDGYPLWYDANGNLTRVYSIDNRVAQKSSSPVINGGITNSFSYGPFYLRVMLNYTVGGYTFSSFGRNIESDGLNIMDQNQSINQLDRWRYAGDVALSPKPIWGVSTKSIMNSTRFLLSKTNIRIQNISLTYSLPEKLIKRAGLRGCNISLIGDNIAMWTPYDKTNRNSYRQSMSGYPMEASYSFNVELTF